MGGDILDQNTTLLLSSAITVIGTLGGAIAGVVLTNRHTTKLEELKIKQEKGKRDATIIEEVYSLLMQINECCMDNISQQRYPTDEVTNELNRVKALVHLYLPSAIPTIDKFMEVIDELTFTIMSTRGEEQSPERSSKITKAFKDHTTWLEASYKELEKLVR